MLWFSQIVGAGDSTPWNYFKVDGVLMNAYDFMQHPMAFENAKEQKIHKYLGYDGPVMMDSGGFLFMKKNDLTVSDHTCMVQKSPTCVFWSGFPDLIFFDRDIVGYDLI